MSHSLLNAKTDHTRHVRLPRRFSYKHFMFAIDLLNIDEIKKLRPLMGVNSFGLYRFDFNDHYVLAKGGMNALEKMLGKEFDRKLEDYQTIQLLTNLKSMGYIFNPISVYLCKLKNSDNFDYIYEVGNTFGEQKYYFSSQNQFTATKNFYVSPFIEHNHEFFFSLSHDDESLSLSVRTQDDLKQPILTASMQGSFEEITKKTILRSFIQHPFINFKVIFLIHLQAFILFIKKLPYHKKSQYPEHQINQHQLR